MEGSACRRLAAVRGAIAPPAAAASLVAAPAAGLLSRLAALFDGGGGGDGDPETDGANPSEPLLPEVTAVVRQCFERPSDEERVATGWGAATGRFGRRPVPALALSTDPFAPDLHPFAAADAGSVQKDRAPVGPPERGLLCQTAEAYAKLRSGLPPESAALLSPERPGSGENLFVDGVTAWELCIGDEFAVVPAAAATAAGEPEPGAGKAGSRPTALLQVSSPRRACEQWNVVHAPRAFLAGTALMGSPPQRTLQDGSPYEASEGNVRHFALQHTLGGIFFRVVQAGNLAVGDTLVLTSRPHPAWPLKRVGDLLYGPAVTVGREGWVNWSGTAEEQRELLAMPELAMHEWKDVLLDPALEMRRDY